MIEEIVLKGLSKGIDSLSGDSKDTNRVMKELSESITRYMSENKKKSYLVPAFICTIMIMGSIIGSMYFFSRINTSSNSDVISKLEEINKKFEMLDPKIPKMSAMHGYYMDPEDQRNNGFRMVRVNKKGFIILGKQQ